MRNKSLVLLLVGLAFCSTILAQRPIPRGLVQKEVCRLDTIREVRAVWLTTIGGLDWPRTKAQSPASRLKQQQELCRMLDELKAIGINTILFQTRTRGMVLYPSAIEPWEGCLTGFKGQHPGYDPLAFAIEECHKRGMQLHAWLVTIPREKVPVGSTKAKTNRAKRGKKGTSALAQVATRQLYHDPTDPATATYLKRLAGEIATHYAVDGIHLDYIRYPEDDGPTKDEAQYRATAEGRTKAQWRRDQITRIVRAISDTVRAQKRGIIMSCAPVGKYADVARYSARGWTARDAVYQDVRLWQKEGLMDLIFPMMYFTGNHFYPFATDWVEQAPEGSVVPGLGIYFLDPKEKNWDLLTIQRELYYLRDIKAGGAAFFRARFLLDNVKGLASFLRHDFYLFPARPQPSTNPLNPLNP